MALIVTYEQLKKLAEKPVVEAEGADFFKEFAAAYKEARNSPEGGGISKAYNVVRNGFLKEHCPPIQFVGEGSSRAAFALDGGLCLKIAKIPAGVAQNKVEARNSQALPDCFPKFYQQCNSHAAILVECVVQLKDDEIGEWKLRHYLDVDVDDLSAAIGDMLDYVAQSADGSAEKGKQIFKKIADDASFDIAWKMLAESILSPKNQSQKMLKALADFTIENYSDFLPTDLENIENWGLALRNGEISLIVLDAGFSEAVAEMYY